jgi:beta-lactamase class A
MLKMDWKKEIETDCRAFSGQCGLVVLDAHGRVAVEHNPRRPFLAASVIKLPILLHYGLLVQSGRLDPGRRLTLLAKDKVSGAGVLQDLAPGCRLTVNDLATLMIILSDNTATNMLIDLLGTDPVNETLDMLALHDTRLRRKMFDWEAQKQGIENVTTARDTADLLLSLWQGRHLLPDMRERLLAILRRQQNRSKLPAQTADPKRWAHKTGELEDADHDAGFLLLDDCADAADLQQVGDRSGRTASADAASAVIVALLTSGGSGRLERLQLANQVGKLVYEQFASRL